MKNFDNKSKKIYGKLYLIPTPIAETEGDFLLPQDRAIVEKLKYFIVENPKTARKYLKLLNMAVPIQEVEMDILDEHTKDKYLFELIKPLKEGNDVGLMSEAGLPGIADPGSKIVRIAHASNIPVIPFVGPSSILLALMGSGLNGQAFKFNGYLPVDQIEREKRLITMENESRKGKYTQIFMETPYRNRHLFNSILKTCAPTTLLSLGIDLYGSNQLIKTAKVADWKNMQKVRIDKVPVIFILSGEK